jgi:transcription elongation factor Elf1
MFQKEAKIGECVTCPRCSHEISLENALRLPTDFSAMCPNCGHRAVYLSAQTHDPIPYAGAVRAAVGIEFSTRKKALAESKSWLSQWTSSMSL